MFLDFLDQGNSHGYDMNMEIAHRKNPDCLVYLVATVQTLNDRGAIKNDLQIDKFFVGRQSFSS